MLLNMLIPSLRSPGKRKILPAHLSSLAFNGLANKKFTGNNLIFDKYVGKQLHINPGTAKKQRNTLKQKTPPQFLEGRLAGHRLNFQTN